MKKFLAMLLGAIALCSCSGNSDEPSSSSIYGVVVDGETGEPLRTVSVQLHKKGKQISGNKYEYNLLTSTVTFDDGHFEFPNLSAADYRLTIASTKYMDVNYNLKVESNRQSSVDIAMLNVENASDKWVQIENILVLLEDSGEEMQHYIAESVANGTVVNGTKDWRLPTTAELVMLYKYKASLNLLDERYWAFTRYYYMDMASGVVNYTSSDVWHRVRLVKTLEF